MIDDIITALSGAGITAAPSSEADPSRADTVPGLVELVDPVVDSALWPLNLPADAPATNGVYNLAGQSSIEVDGYRLGRKDTYVLSLRAPTFDPLRTMSTQLIERVADQSGIEGWEITDAATDYEFDQKQYRAHFELQVTSLAMASPALPAAFVHPVQANTTPNGLGTMKVRQTVTELIAVVLVAEQSEIDAQRRAISSALLGLESPADAFAPLEYAGGQRVAVSGSHVYWRELYGYDRLIRS
ncbi:hypothetical protein SAMN04487958_107201 [Vreelandella subterranea]|uniref:Uncharacterized protein n=1 Tax=Vreelandella subterranea TaxID=416874 RepID=A0A1H9UTZ3_9GAMM|nr:hypothetical protein [Halomonas subterranea]SES12537.1 hypothetical protein SAMN04487958_107201 [Halomonas subterranea]